MTVNAFVVLHISTFDYCFGNCIAALANPFSLFPLPFVTFHWTNFQGVKLLPKICQEGEKGCHFCFLPRVPQILVRPLAKTELVEGPGFKKLMILFIFNLSTISVPLTSPCK